MDVKIFHLFLNNQRLKNLFKLDRVLNMEKLILHKKKIIKINKKLTQFMVPQSCLAQNFC